MTKLVLSFSDFKKEVTDLRQLDYHNEKIDVSVKDAFDDVSKHLNLYHNQNLIGSVRMTERPYSPIQSWIEDISIYPFKNLHSRNIVELSRSVVKKEWRQKSIYKFLMVKICLLCHGLDFDYIVSAIELDMKAKDFLMDLGFEIVGKPSYYNHPPFGRVLCHNIILDLKSDHLKLRQMENNLLNKLFQMGINIIESSKKELM